MCYDALLLTEKIMNRTLTLTWGGDILHISDLDSDGDAELTLENKGAEELNTYITRGDLFALKDHIDYLVCKLNNE